LKNKRGAMLLFYVPCPSLGEAKQIGKTLVEEKLAACANVIKHIESCYFWEGKLNEDNEVLLILKASEKNHAQIEKKIKELHTYDVPCIIAIKPHAVNKEYKEWVEKQSGE
jgi:periplasmic divalent cation tolerance protein